MNAMRNTGLLLAVLLVLGLGAAVNNYYAGNIVFTAAKSVIFREYSVGGTNQDVLDVSTSNVGAGGGILSIFNMFTLKNDGNIAAAGNADYMITMRGVNADLPVDVNIDSGDVDDDGEGEDTKHAVNVGINGMLSVRGSGGDIADLPEGEGLHFIGNTGTSYMAVAGSMERAGEKVTVDAKPLVIAGSTVTLGDVFNAETAGAVGIIKDLQVGGKLQLQGGGVCFGTNTDDVITYADDTLEVAGSLHVTGDVTVDGEYPGGEGGGGLDGDGNLVMEDGKVIKDASGRIIAKMYVGAGNTQGGFIIPETIVMGGGLAGGAARSPHLMLLGADDGNVPTSIDFWNSDLDDNWGGLNTWSMYTRGMLRCIGMTSFGNDKTVWEANPDDRSMSTHNGLTLSHDSMGQTAYAVQRVGQSITEGEELLVMEGAISLVDVKDNHVFATGFPSGCIPTSVQTTVKVAITGGGDAHHYTVGYTGDTDAYGISSGLAIDTKTDCILTPEVLSGARNPKVYVVDSGGDVCSENCTGGTVTIVGRYKAMNSLDDWMPALAFDPVAGTYTGTQNVSITSSVSGVIIRYTTNGTTPTELSTIYTTAVPVTASKTIKARAWKMGYRSTYDSAVYIIN